MCGPTGIGVLYGKRHLLNEMEPFLFGGDMIKEVTLERSSWNDLPHKFEAGTPNIAGAVGFGRAIEYLQGIGMEKIENYCNELTAYALEKLSSIDRLRIIGPRKNRGAVFSFVLRGIHPHDVSEILDSKKIAVRGGHHCAMPLMKSLGITGTSRASFYFYNTKKDVDALIEGIKKVQEVFR
jgi:cysteine desulfurase/selenocysteine lyase